MENHELSKSQGSASSFLSKIGKASLSKGDSSQLPSGDDPHLHKRIEIPFRCAKSGEGFSVRFKDNGPEQRLTIVNIVKSSPSARSEGRSSILWTPDNPRPTVPSVPSVPADRLNWNGWYCPHCLWGRDTSGSRFVRCGSCSQFVCGSAIEIKPDGREIFHCYQECGRVGELGGGVITDFDACEQQSSGQQGHGSDGKRLGGGSQGYLNG